MQILIQSNLSLTVTDSDKCLTTYTDADIDMASFAKICPSYWKVWEDMTKSCKVMDISYQGMKNDGKILLGQVRQIYGQISDHRFA